MAELKGLSRLTKKIEELKVIAEELRETLEEKEEWLDSKSEKYQESDAGTEWQEHLESVGNLLDEIDNLDTEIF